MRKLRTEVEAFMPEPVREGGRSSSSSMSASASESSAISAPHRAPEPSSPSC